MDQQSWLTQRFEENRPRLRGVAYRLLANEIVRTGPYRFAIWINSLWLLITLVGAVALIHCVVIPREEQYLERRFGARYSDYKISVRRWL